MPSKAVLYALLAALSLSCMTFFAKKVTAHYESAAIIFWRFIVSFIYSSVIYKINPLSFFRKNYLDHQWKLHLIRATSTIAAMWCLVGALKTISSVTVNTLNLSHPLFLLVFLLILGRNKFSFFLFRLLLGGLSGHLFYFESVVSHFRLFRLCACGVLGIFYCAQLPEHQHHVRRKIIQRTAFLQFSDLRAGLRCRLGAVFDRDFSL